MLAEHLVGYRTVPHLQPYPQHPSLWRPQPLHPNPHPHAHHHQQLQPNAAFGVLFGVSDRSHFLHHQQQRPPSSAAYSPRLPIDADVSKHAEIAFPRTVERSAPGMAPRPEGRRSCPPPNHLYIPPNQRGKNSPSPTSSSTNGQSPGPMPDPLESEPVQSSSAEPKLHSAEEENSSSANGQSVGEDQSEESATYLSDRSTNALLSQIPLAPNPPAPLHHFRPYKSFPVEGEKYKSFTLTQAQLSYIKPQQQPQQPQQSEQQEQQQQQPQHDQKEDEASATTDGENDAASQVDGNLPPPRSTREVSKRRFPFVYGSLGGCSLSKNIWGRRATKALKSLHQHFTGEAPLAPSAVAHRLSLLTPPPLVDDVSAFDPAKILDDNERIKWLKEVQRKRNRWKKVIRREKEKIVSYYKANGGNVDGCFIDIIQQQQKQQQVAFSYFIYPLFTFPPPSEPTTTTTTTQQPQQQQPQQPEVPTLSLCASSSSASSFLSPLSPRRESENEEEEGDKEQDEGEQFCQQLTTTTTSYNYFHTLDTTAHNNNNHNNNNHNNEERWCQGRPGMASPVPSSDSEGEEHQVGSLSEEMTDSTQDEQYYCRWTAHLTGK